jgi:hypothetical protein
MDTALSCVARGAREGYLQGTETTTSSGFPASVYKIIPNQSTPSDGIVRYTAAAVAWRVVPGPFSRSV